MTAFGLVMLGKLALLVVLFIFCCCCVFTSEFSGFTHFLILKKSFVYFLKLVLDVRRSKLFHFGEKKGRTSGATQA